MISLKTLVKLSSYIKEIILSNNKLVQKKNELVNAIYCVKLGYLQQTLNTFDGNNASSQSRLFKKNNIIGELEVFSDSASKFNYYAVEDENEKKCVLYSIPKEVLRIVLSQEMIKSCISKIHPMLNPIKLENNIKIINFLGQGSFGYVSLIRDDSADGMTYALKLIPKDILVKKTYLINYLISEKNCMLACNSPFIVSLLATFKDKDFCYLIMDYINGYSLSLLESYKVLQHKTYDCLFYLSNLLLILEHLKSKSIVHRDIKLNNIMIDESGYLKLIDFGLATIIKDFTSTTIGTPYYMAPEVIEGSGYSYECDYWSSGVVLYKIFYGSYPFGNNCFNVIDIYESILHSVLKLPPITKETEEAKLINFERKLDIKINNSTFNSEEVKIIIEMLLNKNKRSRIIEISEYTQLLTYINFSDLMELKSTPPYIPKAIVKPESLYNPEDSESILRKRKTLFENDLSKRIGGRVSNYLQYKGKEMDKVDLKSLLMPKLDKKKLLSSKNIYKSEFEERLLDNF